MKQTQCERILRHLKDNGSITTWEAFTEYGITRLASRIWDLKQQGYKFKKNFETKKNRYDENVSFVKYKIIDIK
ncbi:MAG TPA: helix-turn-helix domain-containing protein [Sedimentibacter sp.]|nr:helix-turn-helix domain-containing protein [Sedimentibacter sp.]